MGFQLITPGGVFLACARCCLGSVFSAICILHQTFCGGVFSVHTDLHTQEVALHWEQEFWLQHSIGFDIHNWTAFLRALWTASEWLVFHCTSDFGRLWTWYTGQGLLSDWTCSIPELTLPVCVTPDPQRCWNSWKLPHHLHFHFHHLTFVPLIYSGLCVFSSASEQQGISDSIPFETQNI